MITLSVKGGFPTINLVKYFNKNNIPLKLITSYPSFVLKKRGFPSELIISIGEILVLQKLIQMIAKNSLDKFINTNWYLSEMFDRRASKLIPKDTKLFSGWSNSSLRCIKKAHELGAISIVERGSTHIHTQNALLREEYEIHNMPYIPIDYRAIQKEMAEYEEADYISIPSNFVKKSFIYHGIDEKKLICIPYGVDLDIFKPANRRKDGIFRIIQCSNLSLRKGVQYLLQAFHELNLPGSEIWLIGDTTPEIELFIRKYSASNIILMGTVPFHALAGYYSQGSIFCLPSIEEGLAQVQLQAMACGLPVICTTNTGGEDIIREGIDGFIVPIRDVEALKEKILFMYKNPERRREMGESARLRVQSGFSWDDYGLKMIEEYKRALNAG